MLSVALLVGDRICMAGGGVRRGWYGFVHAPSIGRDERMRDSVTVLLVPTWLSAHLRRQLLLEADAV